MKAYIQNVSILLMQYDVVGGALESDSLGLNLLRHFLGVGHLTSLIHQSERSKESTATSEVIDIIIIIKSNN